MVELTPLAVDVVGGDWLDVQVVAVRLTPLVVDVGGGNILDIPVLAAAGLVPLVVDVGGSDPLDVGDSAPLDVGGSDPLDVGSGDPLDVGSSDPEILDSVVEADMFTVVKNTPGRDVTVGTTVADSWRTNHELEVSNVLLSQRCIKRRTDQLVRQEQWEKH